VGLNSLKSLNLTNGYPNKNNKNKNNKVKSKPLELRSRVKKEVLEAVKFWLQISTNLGQMEGTLFAPNFAPSYAKSKFFNSSEYMYLAVFYVGEYVWVCGCVYKIEKFRTLSAPSEIASQFPPTLRSKNGPIT
jgi:hypothetical protein